MIERAVRVALCLVTAAIAASGCGGDSDASPELSDWRFPECIQTGSGCSSHCSAFSASVSTQACGGYHEVHGCAPNGMANAGIGCFVRNSDHEVIVTSVAPYDRNDLQTCSEAGVASGNVPTCPDGGGP